MAHPPNITRHAGFVDSGRRAALLGQTPCSVWLTGLSGSGKSTVAHALEAALIESGRAAYVLDGDNLRHGLNRDLGFEEAGRQENIRRAAEVAALFVDAGLIVITAFISPFRRDREDARARIGAERFIEVFVDVALEVCEARDPKGLYRKARAGEISDFTGLTSPYEPPADPELTLRQSDSVTASVSRILDYLERRNFLRPPGGAPTS